jgi:hypothetical protein
VVYEGVVAVGLPGIAAERALGLQAAAEADDIAGRADVLGGHSLAATPMRTIREHARLRQYCRPIADINDESHSYR